uniref:Protein kinase domain-containing protein n=1 Tax=Manihot esculenta TaxID=3983 RepID=A0A2C9VEF4_MANES
METVMLLIMLILTVAMVSCSRHVIAKPRCPNCGSTPVPYPLSTDPGCGDPLYRVSCKAGKLWLDALNESSYLIASTNPLTQRLIVRPPGFTNNTCMSADFRSQGIHLDSNLPFNITSSNTIINMNCSESVIQLYTARNCSSTSRCHDYIRENAIAKASCGITTTCCWFTTGGSANEFSVRIREDRCSAYQSFVNLDLASPVSKWPEPGLEVEWLLPREPVCETAVNCQYLRNSMCLQDPISAGKKRCYCRAGFRWDPINGVCLVDRKCQKGGSCHRHKRKTPLIAGSALSAGAMLLGISFTVLVYKNNRRRRGELAKVCLSNVRERIINVSSNGLTCKEITKATNNFSRDNLLGSGGFGEVFKGILYDGTIIAIKRAKAGNTKGIDQIMNEVRILLQVKHRCLVKLLGCCVELEQPLLVFEYISNGTLFDHLHNTGCFGEKSVVKLV